MDNLTARLLGENFEEALKELHNPNSPYAIPFFYQCSAQTLAVVIRELHARLRTAKADGAAEGVAAYIDDCGITCDCCQHVLVDVTAAKDGTKSHCVAGDPEGDGSVCAHGMYSDEPLREKRWKAEGAAEAYDDIRAQAEDLRKEGGIRASLLRLLAEECVSSAAAIRKGIEAKEGK